MRRITTAALLWACFGVAASAAEPTRVGENLIYEAEQWTTPREAWQADHDSEDHWNLWSKNASAGWSGGVVFRSPTVREDRTAAEAGAPVLHTHIEGIPAGTYEVSLNRTGRRLAVSLDGQEWRPTEPNVEDSLGTYRIEDGAFDLWVDDRYATSWNIGPGYYDYIRFQLFKPPTLSHFEVFVPPVEAGSPFDGVLPEITWISDRPVPTGVLEIERDGVFERMDTDVSLQPKLRNHRAPISPTEESRFRVRVTIQFGEGFEWTSEPIEIRLPAEAASTQPSSRIDVLLSLASGLVPERPLLVGVPFARGTLWTSDGLSASDQAGVLPSQVAVTSRWPDGSVRWLFTRLLPRPDSRDIRLTKGASDSQTAEAAEEMACEGDGVFKSNSLRFDNGVLGCGWDSGDENARFSLFDRVARHGGDAVTGKPELGNVRLIDGEGRAWGLGPAEECVWEETGPVRAVLRVAGHFQAEDGTRRFAYKLRYFFTAHSPLVQVQLTLVNDATGPEFQRVRSFAMRIPIAGEGALRGQLAGCEPVEVAEAGQDELWQIDAGKLRAISKGQSSMRQERSPGWAIVQRGGSEIALAIRDFWQTWPKSIALKPDGLHVRLLPDLSNDKYVARDLMDWMRQGYAFDEDGCYLLRRGMALRHEFWVRFGQAGDVEQQGGADVWASAVLSPPHAAADPDQYCESGAFGPVQSAVRDGRPEYESMVERNVQLVLQLRDATGEYGWMNFGDWHGERTYNWGNNEYDLSWAMALQFARTGRWDYFGVGLDMARHYATVDTIHAAANDGMPGRVWSHGVGHVGVGDRTPGSGPAAEALHKWLESGEYNKHFYRGLVDTGGHIYQEGNFANYFLTGDRDLLEAAELVCTAQATFMTPGFDFGIERGAGWPLSNAVAAYESTGNPFYLNAARIYVERILQKHDPAGGGWLLPQPASECDGKQGVGGKAFATGILLYGLMRYDLVEPRAEVKDCIVNACRWLVEQAWNEEKVGFRYKTGCDKYRDDTDEGPSSALCLPGLMYGYKLSGDQRFLQVVQKALPKVCQYRDKNGKQAGMICRQSAYALPGLGAGRRD